MRNNNNNKTTTTTTNKQTNKQKSERKQRNRQNNNKTKENYKKQQQQNTKANSHQETVKTNCSKKQCQVDRLAGGLNNYQRERNGIWTQRGVRKGKDGFN